MKRLWLCVSLLVLGCGDDSGSDPDAGIDAGPDGGDDSGMNDGGMDGSMLAPKGCDPIAPSYCGFPFPNDYWTEADATTPTGLRLALPSEIMPETGGGVRSTPDAFNEADGFSSAIAAMVHIPGATGDGLATPDTIGDSLLNTSRTVILDTVTGQRVAHWVDVDAYVVEAKKRVEAMAELPEFTIARPLEELEQERALMLRPAMRLEDGRRYIVAVLGVVDADDNVAPAAPEFAALRDGTMSSDPNIEARRVHFETIFSDLSAAGVSRGDIQVAWDFTTASKENNTAWMVHIRDDAFSNFPNGVSYTVQNVTEGFDATTACRLEIDFDMPLYMTKGEAGGVINFGSGGMPEQNGTFEYSAAMVVPKTAQTTPAKLVEFGHGQLGAKEQVLGFQPIADALNIAAFGLDFKGFAFDDQATIATVLTSGDLSGFRAIPERMHQGILNFLMAMRTLYIAANGDAMTPLNQALVTHCGGAEIDGDQRYYFGGSQGGILGATLMALSTDVTRGMLAVPGQPYNLLLNRSVNFDAFAPFFYAPYDWNALDAQMNLALIQGLWDRAEPSGYSKYIRTDLLPGTPAHEVLIQVSKSDHQVTNLGAHIMARTIGNVVNLQPVIRSVWGIDEVMGEHTGSAMVEVDFGNPEAPLLNIPMWDDILPDPHGRATEVPAIGDMLLQFYETGTVENLCNGKCDGDDL